MGQPDTGLRCGGQNSLGQFRRVVIRRATGLVVNIVKLANCGIARLLHFHEHQAGNGFDLVWGQMVEKLIH